MIQIGIVALLYLSEIISNVKYSLELDVLDKNINRIENFSEVLNFQARQHKSLQ